MKRNEMLKRRRAHVDAQVPERCQCCGKPPNAGKALCLDHCHVTGLLRGWLCHSCNLGIGLLGDSLDGVQAAARYLRAASRGPVAEPSKRVASMLARLPVPDEN